MKEPTPTQQLLVDAIHDLEDLDLTIEAAYVNEQGCFIVIGEKTFREKSTNLVINKIRKEYDTRN